MAIRLRGHHLMCMLGYRGMGYSPDYAANMSAVQERLRTEPETDVLLAEGPDDLCVCYPPDGNYHCESRTVHARDEQILVRLGLKAGETHTWGDIMSRIERLAEPEDIPRWCSTCPWLPLGLCEEGVRRVRDGHGLVTLPRRAEA